MGIENVNILQDQNKYVGDEPQKQEYPDLVEQKPVLPLDEGTVERAQSFEEQRKSDLETAREIHNRVTAGEDPDKVREELT